MVAYFGESLYLWVNNFEKTVPHMIYGVVAISVGLAIASRPSLPGGEM